MATTYGNTMGHTGTMGGSLGNAGSIAKDKIDTASDSLKGAVDQGTQKAAEVKDRIEKVGKGGGYMISSANSITDYCKLENVWAMSRAIGKYRTYR